MRIVNGSLRRWVPLAVLALFAAAEFAAQYLFIATPFAQAVGIPDSALRFIEVSTVTHDPASISLHRSAIPPASWVLTCVHAAVCLTTFASAQLSRSRAHMVKDAPLCIQCLLDCDLVEADAIMRSAKDTRLLT